MRHTGRYPRQMTDDPIQPKRRQRLLLFSTAVLLLTGVLLWLPQQFDLDVSQHIFAWLAAAAAALSISLVFTFMRWGKPVGEVPPAPRWLMAILLVRLTIFAATVVAIAIMLASWPLGLGSRALFQSVLLELFTYTLVSLWWSALYLAWERLTFTPPEPPSAAH